MLRHLRACLRIIVLLHVTILCFACHIFFNRWFSFSWVKCWARLTASLLGMNIRVKGTVPESPFFLVSNHISYLDILFLWTQVDATFVSKAEVQNWPLIGYIAKSLGTIFIQRRNKKELLSVNQQILNQLKKEHGLIVFPEGTSSDGSDILPFRSALLEPLMVKDAKVIVAYLSYSSPSDKSNPSETICWWNLEESFVTHFYRLCKIKSFVATVVFSAQKEYSKDRKILACELHSTIKQLKRDFVC